MLAYVFWHQRESLVIREDYQARLQTFHQALQRQSPQGFATSFVLEIPASLPWMDRGEEVYEDWYLLENSAALDPLDQYAITESRREPHDQIARLASRGTGGLYRLKSDSFASVKPAEIRFETWFSKPVGMDYQQLYELLSQSGVGPEEWLWQRKMTLGIGLEFCLHSVHRKTLPEEIESLLVETHIMG